MKISPEQLSVLMKPLNPSRVTRRSQGGAQLSYLEAWDVKATLIRVFGFGGFSAEVIDSQVVSLDRVPAFTGGRDNRKRKTDDEGNPAFNWQATAMATVRLTVHGRDGERDAVYTETAASSQVNPEPGEALDFAVKTAESDALKRAAIYLGTQFGLSLYAGVTTDVIRKVFAPGQTEKAEVTNVPGTPDEDHTPEQTAAQAAARAEGQALVDRATSAAKAKGRPVTPVTA